MVVAACSLHCLGTRSGLGLWYEMDLFRWHSLPWRGGILGRGRQDPASTLTEGQEPDKPSSPSNLCQREQTGGESHPKSPRAVELQNIHPGAVLEGPWGLLKPEGTRQWRIYGSTNAVLAPAVCWPPLIGCTALTTVIWRKDLHKTSKCLSHHLLVNHPKHCSSCPACLESPAPHGPRPPPVVLDVSHLFMALLWGG